MQNRKSWTCDKSRIKSFLLSIFLHITAVIILFVTSLNMKWENEIFIVEMVEIPEINKVEKKVEKIKKNFTQNVKQGKNIKTSKTKKQISDIDFNPEEYKKKLLAKIGSENRKRPEVSSKIKKVEVPALNSLSIDFRETKFSLSVPSWYVLELKNRIEKNWRFQNVLGNFSVIVSFRVYRNGTITDIKIEKSSGYDPFDRSALIAIKSTKDLPSFPAEIKENFIDVMIEFKKEDI